MINVFDQSVSEKFSGRSQSANPRNGSLGTATVHEVTVENITGSCVSPGKITCAAGTGLACKNIALRNVVLDVQGPSDKYTCENVNGTQEGCVPVSCPGLVDASPIVPAQF